MSGKDPVPIAGGDAAQVDQRVSTVWGRWSLGLAVGSVLAVTVVNSVVWIAVLYAVRTGPTTPVFKETSAVANTAIEALAMAMVIPATILGAMSIAGAWGKTYRPGGLNALVLGCFGIGLSVLTILAVLA